MTHQGEESYHSAMVVVAHANDAKLRCPGTVATWSKQGIDVVYVVCTNGSRGSRDREITPERLSKIRMEEQRAAGRVLGLKDIVFLEYQDGSLEPTVGIEKRYYQGGPPA